MNNPEDVIHILRDCLFIIYHSLNFYETPQMEVMSLELESAILTVSDNTVVGPDPEYPD